MPVPLLDLKPQLAPLREEIMAAVAELVDSTGYILGPEVADLEASVAAYCAGSTPAGPADPADPGKAAGIAPATSPGLAPPAGDELSAIGVSSGTDALLVSLMALGVGPGDLVLTTPYTFFATMGCILRLGARPVFIDIEPHSYNLDPAALAEFFHTRPADVARVKACIPVHLYGQLADMDAILPLCAAHGIPVVEDAAQAIGAAGPLSPTTAQVAGLAGLPAEKPPAGQTEGNPGAAGAAVWRRAGSMGATGCFSFFPSKNLGGIGDGGMVICRDEELAEKIRVLRVHGGAPKYHHGLVGGNFRLDPVQAVVLAIKLRHLPAWHAARRDNAARYRSLFTETGLVAEGAVELPEPVYRERAAAAGVADYHIYNQFVIRARRRDGLISHLHQRGIGCEIYYPVPLHRQGCVAEMGYREQEYPETERAARETLALPIYPELSEEMLQEVVTAVTTFYRRGPGAE